MAGRLAGLGYTQVCRKVVAAGRNYAEHAKELGNAIPTKPVLFLKPPSSFLVEGASPIEIPAESKGELHHEVELGVVIGKAGRDIPEADVASHIAGYFCALDMTSRSLQNDAKTKGLPWSVAKGYDTFLPVSPMVPASRIPDPMNVELWCKVNGELRQKGSTSAMLFSVSRLISYISTVFRLEEGDCILTGTPEGVGPVRSGDSIQAGITGIPELDIAFTAAERRRAKL